MNCPPDDLQQQTYYHQSAQLPYPSGTPPEDPFYFDQDPCSYPMDSCQYTSQCYGPYTAPKDQQLSWSKGSSSDAFPEGLLQYPLGPSDPLQCPYPYPTESSQYYEACGTRSYCFYDNGYPQAPLAQGPYLAHQECEAQGPDQGPVYHNSTMYPMTTQRYYSNPTQQALIFSRYSTPAYPEGIPKLRRDPRKITNQKVKALEESYMKNKRYIKGDKKILLARQLGLTEQQVEGWFNRRRKQEREEETRRFYS